MDESLEVFERRQAIAEETFNADMRWAMRNRRSRRIMFVLLARAGVFRLSFDPDPRITAFNEGRRSYGLQLMDDLLRVTPSLYDEMIQENRNGPTEHD